MGLLTLLCVLLITVQMQAAKDNDARVEVRAVLISCEPVDGRSVPFENDALRFEREELYKHSVLRDCKNKIALTVKFVSDPENSGDEYIPIEHVFQGPMKRVRLLNPYVLRLRRETPVQAYKLRKIDTVCGTLAEDIKARMTRNSESSDETVQDRKQNMPLRTDSSGLDSSEIISTAADSSTALVLDDKMLGETVNFHEKNDAGGISYAGHKPKIKEPEPNEVSTKLDWPEEEEPNTSNQIKAKRVHSKTIEENLGEYDMYEIGSAELWYTIQVQLFEKLTTPEGKTAWKDLTRGKPARVSSSSPEWTGQDMSVVYKLSEWIPREGFTLPLASLCLLAPVTRKATATLKVDATGGQYIVVPFEDIEGLPTAENGTKLSDDGKLSDMGASTNQGKSLRRVLIRSSRALLGGDGVKVHIVPKDGDQYLTLLHRQPYHVQLDLEAKADDNQLVQVGSQGRVMTVVSDSSRRTRTVLTVQATNMGLAAARFKVIARDCNPELPELLNEKINEEDASFVVLPPKHTQSIIIDVPAEIPADVAHCSVALINGDYQTVAVRDVAIKKGDRCFCVWHCECVCLSEDPKLSCREMAEARQVAAGLAVHERTRLVRAVCYHDVLSLNFCFTAFGVIVTLLLFGLIKAILGLGCRWIGACGLALLLQMPRKLDHYYEAKLRERPVLYDDEGWPVHPDTKQRTVRLASLPMEFVLNTVFFVVAPCILMYEGLKLLYSRCTSSDGDDSSWSLNKCRTHKRCYNSRENIVQSSGAHVRRRAPRLQRWMTPEAERLTSNVLQEGLPTRASMIRDYMRPLLCETLCRGDGAVGANSGAGVAVGQSQSGGAAESCGDSELDDTEYILMQMQKSRESLAKPTETERIRVYNGEQAVGMASLKKLLDQCRSLVFANGETEIFLERTDVHGIIMAL